MKINDRVEYHSIDESSGASSYCYGVIVGFSNPSGYPMVHFDGNKTPTRIPHYAIRVLKDDEMPSYKPMAAK